MTDFEPDHKQRIHDQQEGQRTARRLSVRTGIAGLALAASIAALAVALVRNEGETTATAPPSGDSAQAVAVAATTARDAASTRDTVEENAEASESEAAGASETAETVYRAAAAGVVEVTANVESIAADTQFGPDGGESEAQGSGFVIDERGHVVTNEHVVSGASSVSVTFADGSEAAAEVVATDPSSDIALLQVDASTSDLAPLELGSSSDLVVGQDVYALGNPYGLEGTLTAGIVSALDRTIQAPNGYTIDGAIQTDAAMNSGNSGGPLLDSEGRVVGVTAQIETTTGGNVGIGYAIPIDLVKEVVSQLESGGAVDHAYLGVAVESATEGGAPGAAIAEVRSGSPADEAGLQTGDVVTAVDGEPVDAPDDLTAAVAEKQPGDELELTIVRDGSEQTITVTLGQRPDDTA
jgi:putative serine protease PepD